MSFLAAHMKESTEIALQESAEKDQEERSLLGEGSYPAFLYPHSGWKSLKFYPRGQDGPLIWPPDELVRR